MNDEYAHASFPFIVHRSSFIVEPDTLPRHMKDHTIGFVGGGNMAEAMIRGLLRGKVFAPENVIVSGPREERMLELRDKFGIRATTDNREAAASRIVVLSV